MSIRCKNGSARVSRLCPGEMLMPVVVGVGGLLSAAAGFSLAQSSLPSRVASPMSSASPRNRKPSPYVCGKTRHSSRATARRLIEGA